MTTIELCKELKLGYIKENYELAIAEASETNQDYAEFLHNLLASEYDKRIENSIKRRIREAKFPQNVLLADFDKSVYDEKFLPTFDSLETLDFIAKKENVILLGASGAGKTFYASALGTQSCMRGKSVLFITVSDLIIKLKEIMSENQITAFKRRFKAYDLVILDELGYYSFDKAAAELFFNIMSTREFKGGIIITSNLNFDEWTAPLGDKKLTAALVARLCRNAHILQLERDGDGRMQDSLARKQASELA